jgi:TRAP-type C4-dicarboxylate transport system substrate-binding protein
MSASKIKINWLLGHKNLDYFEEAAAAFKSAVEKGSDGAIEVEITTIDEDHGSGRANAATAQIAAKVAKGEAQMGHSFADVMGAVEPRMHVFETPYLFRGNRHMEGLIAGPIGTGLLTGLRSHGILGLSFTYSGGPSGLATIDGPLQSPEDLKGLKVGVYGDKVNDAWLTSLGARTVAIEHRLEDILPKARAGSLDAVVITWRNFEQASLHHDFKYFSLPGSTYLVSVTYINEAFFASLPSKFQSLVKKASIEAAAIERAKTIELNEESMRLVLPKGVRPVHLTVPGRKAFGAALKPAYAAIDALLGKEFVEAVKGAQDADVHPAAAASLAAR